MTFKNSKIDEVIKEIPLDRILLETDSPYLTPEPFRKYSNEPKYIRTIAEYLANIKNINISEVEKVTENNVHNLFLI
jgi:TatD DNase family protein